jgi:hypothetical protein
MSSWIVPPNSDPEPLKARATLRQRAGRALAWFDDPRERQHFRWLDTGMLKLALIMTSVLCVLVLVAWNAGWASADTNYHDPGLLQTVADDALFFVLWTVIYYIAVGYFPVWFAVNTVLVFCLFYFLAGWASGAPSCSPTASAGSS